ncbi:MAG: hypothetical protein KF693_14115 [Nitrospira sp.]|nr:hypothetical protein [Nitrospira sp.]
MAKLDGVFAGGDTKRGASLIEWVIAEGQKMAPGPQPIETKTIPVYHPAGSVACYAGAKSRLRVLCRSA